MPCSWHITVVASSCCSIHAHRLSSGKISLHFWRKRRRRLWPAWPTSESSSLKVSQLVHISFMSEATSLRSLYLSDKKHTQIRLKTKFCLHKFLPAFFSHAVCMNLIFIAICCYSSCVISMWSDASLRFSALNISLLCYYSNSKKWLCSIDIYELVDEDVYISHIFCV